jgi:hypothetical protein
MASRFPLLRGSEGAGRPRPRRSRPRKGGRALPPGRAPDRSARAAAGAPRAPGGGLVVGAARAASVHICAAASSGEIEGDGMGPPPGARSWAPSMPSMYCRPVSMSTSTRNPASVVHGHQPQILEVGVPKLGDNGLDRGLERVRAGRRVLGGHDPAPLVHPEGVRPPRGPAMPSAWPLVRPPATAARPNLRPTRWDLQVGVEPSQPTRAEATRPGTRLVAGRERRTRGGNDDTNGEAHGPEPQHPPLQRPCLFEDQTGIGARKPLHRNGRPGTPRAPAEPDVAVALGVSGRC